MQLARFPSRPGDKVSETLSGLLSGGRAAIQWAKWYNEHRSCGRGCAALFLFKCFMQTIIKLM